MWPYKKISSPCFAFISSESSPLNKLYLGGSLSHGIQKNDLGGITFTTPAQTNVFVFNDSVTQNGKANIYGFDLEWLLKRFSLKGEFLNYRLTNLKKNNSIFDFEAEGCYLTATFLITGESKKRNAFIKPKKEFDLIKGNWGAFELIARYENAKLPSSLLLAGVAKGVNNLKAITVGVNWYLNDDVKLVLNYSKYSYQENLLVENRLYSGSSNVFVRAQFQF